MFSIYLIRSVIGIPSKVCERVCVCVCVCWEGGASSDWNTKTGEWSSSPMCVGLRVPGGVQEQLPGSDLGWGKAPRSSGAFIISGHFAMMHLSFFRLHWLALNRRQKSVTIWYYSIKILRRLTNSRSGFMMQRMHDGEGFLGLWNNNISNCPTGIIKMGKTTSRMGTGSGLKNCILGRILR